MSVETVETDQYDTLFREMREGLLLSINNAVHSATPSFELRVEHSRDNETHVTLSGPGADYRIHRDRCGDLVYSEVTDSALSYEDKVVTFEVLGYDDQDGDSA